MEYILTQESFLFMKFLTIFYDFSKFCSISGVLLLVKSSKLAKIGRKWRNQIPSIDFSLKLPRTTQKPEICVLYNPFLQLCIFTKKMIINSTYSELSWKVNLLHKQVELLYSLEHWLLEQMPCPQDIQDRGNYNDKLGWHCNKKQKNVNKQLTNKIM